LSKVVKSSDMRFSREELKSIKERGATSTSPKKAIKSHLDII
jgi:hypothetical protein